MKLPLLGSPSSAALTTTTMMPHVSASGDAAAATIGGLPNKIRLGRCRDAARLTHACAKQIEEDKWPKVQHDSFNDETPAQVISLRLGRCRDAAQMTRACAKHIEEDIWPKVQHDSFNDKMPAPAISLKSIDDAPRRWWRREDWTIFSGR
jgi:hypothetical protein